MLGKLLSTETLVKTLFGRLSLKEILQGIFKSFGLSDVLGFAITYLSALWVSNGRTAVERAVTIRESSLTDWGRKIHGDNQEAIGVILTRMKEFSKSFANLVEAFIPRNKI